MAKLQKVSNMIAFGQGQGHARSHMFTWIYCEKVIGYWINVIQMDMINS